MVILFIVGFMFLYICIKYNIYDLKDLFTSNSGQEIINKEVINYEIINKEVINQEIINKEVINQEIKLELKNEG